MGDMLGYTRHGPQARDTHHGPQARDTHHGTVLAYPPWYSAGIPTMVERCTYTTLVLREVHIYHPGVEREGQLCA